jgi:hypothetical protein
LPHLRKTFGPFGLVFTLKTILGWGAAPVWYIPNNHDPVAQSQYGKFGEAVSGILQLVQLLKELKDAPQSESIGKDKILKSVESLEFMVSHFKGMSPLPKDDQSYTREREWRLVAGFEYPYHMGASPFRLLTEEQKAELIKRRPDWGRPMRTGNRRIDLTLLSEDALVNSFCYFDGLLAGKHSGKVASKIEKILVPSASLADRVQAYLQDNRTLFSPHTRVSFRRYP